GRAGVETEGARSQVRSDPQDRYVGAPRSPALVIGEGGLGPGLEATNGASTEGNRVRFSERAHGDPVGRRPVEGGRLFQAKNQIVERADRRETHLSLGNRPSQSLAALNRLTREAVAGEASLGQGIRGREEQSWPP